MTSDNTSAYTYEAPSEWTRVCAIGKARNIVTLCRRNDIVPKNLLEIGAGDGAILNELAEADFCPSMHAVEISASGVSVIASRGIKHLESCSQFDGYTLTYPDKYFDLIILSHVLEHVEHERVLLREILRVGKNFVIEIPLDYNSLENDENRSLLLSYGHINVYTTKILKFLLHTTGFVIIDDLLGMYGIEALSYMHFESKGKNKTDFATRAFSLVHRLNKEAFNKLSRKQQEQQSAFYTVLACQATSKNIMKTKLDDAMALLRRGNIHYSDMIVNSCISDHGKLALATEIMKTCQRENRTDAAEHYRKLIESFNNKKQ